MTDETRLAAYVSTWREAIAEFVALAREIPEDQWDTPTDLEGWSVKDNVAHTAHLEGVLAGTPEDSVQVAEAPHIKSLTGYYTESGVVARRGRPMADLADEIEQAAATRSAELDANPPVDGPELPPPPHSPAPGRSLRPGGPAGGPTRFPTTIGSPPASRVIAWCAGAPP